MRTVKIKKSDLIQKVRTNAAGHRELFERAFEGYRRECVNILELALDTLKKNKSYVVRFSETPPEDHSDEYARTIAMLEMSVDDVIELTAQEFQQYVLDDWSWKRNWTLSNSKYTGA